MVVPEEIRAVERPKNTVVVDRGGNGPKRFAVVERVGCRRVGKRNIPVNGATVGHIIDGRYVPKGTRIKTDAAKLPERAPHLQPVPSVRFFWGVAEAMRAAYDTCGIRRELADAFGVVDATTILAIACLRVLRPGIADRDIADAYASSWVSEVLPGARLSEDGSVDAHASIGLARDKVLRFMRRRVHALAKGHRIAICRVSAIGGAGTNDLRHLTRTPPSGAAAETQSAHVAYVVYALDAEEGVPICGKAFSDTVSYEDAIADLTSEFGIEHSLVVDNAGLTADLAAVLHGCGHASAFGEAGAQSSESVVGTALLDFVAACIGMRLTRMFDEAHLLEEATFDMVMDELTGTVMVGSHAMEWELVCATRHAEETLRTLGLVDEQGRPLREPVPQ